MDTNSITKVSQRISTVMNGGVCGNLLLGGLIRYGFDDGNGNPHTYPNQVNSFLEPLIFESDEARLLWLRNKDEKEKSVGQAIAQPAETGPGGQNKNQP